MNMKGCIYWRNKKWDNLGNRERLVKDEREKKCVEHLRQCRKFGMAGILGAGGKVVIGEGG